MLHSPRLPLHEPLGSLGGLLCLAQQVLTGLLGLSLCTLVDSLVHALLALSPCGSHARGIDVVGCLLGLAPDGVRLGLARLLESIELGAHGMGLCVVQMPDLPQGVPRSVLGPLDVGGVGGRQRCRAQGVQRGVEVRSSSCFLGAKLLCTCDRMS